MNTATAQRASTKEIARFLNKYRSLTQREFGSVMAELSTRKTLTLFIGLDQILSYHVYLNFLVNK